MPTFFFHVRDGGGLTLDPDGADLPDLDAARAEALAAAREIRARAARSGQALADRRFEIADGGGRVLATVAIKDVLDSR